MELFVYVLRTGPRDLCFGSNTIGFLFPSILLATLFFFVLPDCLQSQNNLVVESTDQSKWPLITTRFYLLDLAGQSVSDVSKEKMKVRENGTEREILSFNCPSTNPSGNISAILSIDISVSMANVGSGGRMPNIELARAAADAWINALPEGSSECGITSFDDRAYGLTDLTTDRRLMRAAVETLKPSGGTNYDAALLSSPAGGLPLLSKGKHRRVLVFLTDGLSKSNPEPIIAEAKRIDGVIFCVTLGMRTPDVLKEIAEKTGGGWFENVTTVEEAEAIYRAILYRARGGQPCEITWQSGSDCDPERSIVMSYTSPSLRNNFGYTAPDRSIPRLTISPTILFFDSATHEGEVTFTAPAAPVRIDRIEQLPGGTEFVIEMPSLPITLGSGESRTLKVRSRTNSSSYAVSQWKIESSCYATTLVARRSGAKNEVIPIHLVSPNGGEVFNAGERALITWDGVAPETPVRLEYSINAGRTWTIIAEGVTGGLYSWHVPGTPSTDCLARVSVITSEKEATRVATLPVEKHHWGIDPKGEFIAGYLGDTTIVTSGSTRTPAGNFGLWSVATGNLVKTWMVVGDAVSSYKDPTPTSVEYDPTGRYILCGKYMLDAKTGKLLWWTQGGKANTHGYMVEDAITSSFSPDGDKVLLRIAKDGGEVLGILDSKTGRTIRTVGDLRLGISTAQFSPDGKTVLTSARDGVTLWNANTGTQTKRLTERSSYSTTFSRSGKYVAAVPNSSDSMLVWEAATNAPPQSIFIGKNASGYKAARFAPDETGVVVWRDGRPGIADFRSGEVRMTYGEKTTSRSALRLAYSPDGTMASMVEPYGSVKQLVLTDAATGNIITTARDSGSMVGISMGVSADGAHVVWSYGYNLVIADVNGGTGTDKSDDLWTILGKADPQFVDVDFGKHKVGTSRDSVISGFLSNRGNAPLRVESIDIVDGDNENFDLVSPLPPFDVPAGSVRSVEFRFAPTSTGKKGSVALMKTDVGRLSARLTGNGVGATLRVEGDVIDFGEKEVGKGHDTTLLSFIRAIGSSSVTIISAELTGANRERFQLRESLNGKTLEGGTSIPLSLQFLPDTIGLFSAPLLLTLSDGEEVTVAVHGRGGMGAERYPDPTTFRTVAIPNAVIPPAGTFIAGSYDLLGLMAGYSFTDNIMILAGGAPPLPDDWGGTNGSAFGAYSIGLKGNLHLNDRLQVAAGFQWGASFYEEESTPEDDSRIITPTLYGAISYGNDDRRISLTGGYAFKRHTTLVDPATGLIDEFPKEAPIIALGGDWRVGDRWKLAAEGVYMKTVGTAPIITTARWFGKTWALDFGAAWLLIETGEDTPPSFPVAPLISFVWVYPTR